MSQPTVKRELRSPREIEKMRAAGLVVWEAHQAAYHIIRPGVSTAEINEVYKATFERYGATPLFLDYGEIPGRRPPFPAETCISINEELVHGIPGKRRLAEGDIVSLDTGCRLNGWCGDAAVTLPIGKIDSTKQHLLAITNQVLDRVLDWIQVKTLWSDVAREMEMFVRDAGLTVIEDMVGHGIGKNLHEPPQVPNYYSEEIASEEDFDLRPGVVLAIEPMISVGTAKLVEAKDGWTLSTGDRKPSAHFEHTIAITKEGPKRLTGPPEESERSRLPDWLQDESKWLRW